jgi:hypothetical protein
MLRPALLGQPKQIPSLHLNANGLPKPAFILMNAGLLHTPLQQTGTLTRRAGATQDDAVHNTYSGLNPPQSPAGGRPAQQGARPGLRGTSAALVQVDALLNGALP